MIYEEKRKYSRSEVDWPADIISTKGLIEGEVRNISLGGAYIRCDDLPKGDEIFDLSIVVPEKDYQHLWGKAEMVWSESHASESSLFPQGLGARFTEIPKEDLKSSLEDEDSGSKDIDRSTSNKTASEEAHFHADKRSTLTVPEKNKIRLKLSEHTKKRTVLVGLGLMALVIVLSIFVLTSRKEVEGNNIKFLQRKVKQLEQSLLREHEQIEERLLLLEQQGKELREFRNRLNELEALISRSESKENASSLEIKDAKKARTLQPTAKKPMVLSNSSAFNVKEPLSPARKILAIEPVELNEDFDVHIISDGRLDNYDVSLLTDPPRLVLDLIGVNSSEVKDVLILNGPWVKKVRIGRYPDKVRVVFDLVFTPKKEVPYEILLEEKRLVISFLPDS